MRGRVDPFPVGRWGGLQGQPADLPKVGSHHDLAIALALLAILSVIPQDQLAHFAAIGALSLDGRLGETAGVLPAAMAAEAIGLCPASCWAEAAWSGGDVQPDAPGAALLSEAAEKLRLTARGYTRVLKVARTIADLDGSEGVRRVHLAEALSYRYRPAAEASRPGEGAFAR